MAFTIVAIIQNFIHITIAILFLLENFNNVDGISLGLISFVLLFLIFFFSFFLQAYLKRLFIFTWDKIGFTSFVFDSLE